MGLFDSFKQWFQKVDDVQEMANNGVEQARSVTKMIPGDADDKVVDTVADKVDDIVGRYDEIKNNIPGN